MMNNFRNEQARLLHQIDLISFVIVEMNLYLDTHPDDSEAVEYLKHYAHMKNQFLKVIIFHFHKFPFCYFQPDWCGEAFLPENLFKRWLFHDIVTIYRYCAPRSGKITGHNVHRCRLTSAIRA